MTCNEIVILHMTAIELHLTPDLIPSVVNITSSLCPPLARKCFNPLSPESDLLILLCLMPDVISTRRGETP